MHSKPIQKCTTKINSKLVNIVQPWYKIVPLPLVEEKARLLDRYARPIPKHDPQKLFQQHNGRISKDCLDMISSLRVELRSPQLEFVALLMRHKSDGSLEALTNLNKLAFIRPFQPTLQLSLTATYPINTPGSLN